MSKTAERELTEFAKTDTHSLEATKVCSGCDLLKVLSDFVPDTRRKDGRGAKCFDCVHKARVSYYSKYPDKEAEHRLRSSAASQAWYLRNRASQIERFRWARVLKLYGLTKPDYERMLEAQGGLCAICRTDTPGRDDQHFAIDHDHTTGHVRGLLCQRCNSGLGFFSEKPDLLRVAALYLEERRQS